MLFNRYSLRWTLPCQGRTAGSISRCRLCRYCVAWRPVEGFRVVLEVHLPLHRVVCRPRRRASTRHSGAGRLSVGFLKEDNRTF